MDLDVDIYNSDLNSTVASFNGNSNPETGTKVVNKAGDFYVLMRFDTNTPSKNCIPYNIEVYTGNNLQYQYYSTLMMRQYMRSAHLI